MPNIGTIISSHIKEIRVYLVSIVCPQLTGLIITDGGLYQPSLVVFYFTFLELATFHYYY